MPLKIAAAAAIVLALCIGLLVFTMGDGGEPRQPSGEVVLQPEGPAAPGEAKAFFTMIEGRPAPPDEAFFDGKGTAVKLSAFRGKIVVLNFWATWCAPCVKELPSLDRLQVKRGGADFVVVAIDAEKHSETKAGPFMADLGITALEPYYDAKMKLWHALNLQGLPTTILIDPDGRMIARHEGEAEWDSDKVLAEIDRLLATQ
jgi:thiol-disulfide isomerase/thioredoxin